MTAGLTVSAKDDGRLRPPNKTYIVMSVANEEATIEETIEGILSLQAEGLVVCLVMDFFSKDRTEDIVRSLIDVYPEKVELLFHSASSGFASCFLHGFKHALAQQATYVVEMDAGGSHQPTELLQFLAKLDEGYECVLGSRFAKGGSIASHPWHRRLLSKAGTFISNAVLGTRLTDMTSGFEAFRTDALSKLDLDSFLSTQADHLFNTELRYYMRKAKILEVPITYMGSSSTLRLRTVLRSLRLLFLLPRQDNARAL
jgi:dolichol-phosphate mannosyltransferase